MFQLLVSLTRIARRWALTGFAVTSLCLLASLAVRPPVASAASGACTLPTTDYGTVSGLSITTTGTTTNIYSRIAIPDTTDNNYLLEIDNSSDVAISCYTVSAGAGAVYTTGASQHFNSDSSNWVNTTVSNLPAGTYHLKLIGNAPNVMVDRLILAQNANCTPVGTGDNCVQQDTTPPTVSVATAGNIVSVGTSASPVTVTATASDDVAVARVEFYVDGNLVGSDLTTPYTYSFNPNNFSIASHTITAKAFDSSANSATSSGKTLAVTDTTHPTVSITSPTDGSTAGSTISLAAQASDNVGLTKVDFYADGPPGSGTLLKTVSSGLSNMVLTKANSGGASGTAFGSVSLTGAAAITYSAGAAAHGGMSYKTVATGSDSARAYLFNSTSSLASARVYFKLNSFTGAQQLLSIQQGATPFTFVAKAGISASGYFTVTDASGTIYTSPSPATIGTWYRLELQAKAGTTTSNGTVNFQYFEGDSTAPDSSFSTTSANTSTLAFGRAAFGKFDSGTSLDANFDDFAFDVNTLTPIGPVTQNPSSATLVQNNAEGGAVSFSASYTNALAGGVHSITAIAYDTTGNTTTSSPVNITVPDTTPPSISNIAVTNVSGSQATITWSTDENSDSQVEYGLTTSYGSSTTLNTSLTKSHSVILSGLVDTTTYHFKVKSKDSSSNLATSTDRTLTTLDTTKPSVTITSPSNNSTQTGTITVAVSASDNVSIDHVDFYVAGALKQSLSSSPYNFSLDTNDYASGSYTLTAKAYDTAGNTTTSSPINIIVPDMTPPVISSVQTANITGSGATVTWTTDENADSQVEYGLTTSYGSSSTLNTTMTKNHSVTLSGLSDAATYHYRVKSKDTSGNLSTSSDQTFTTPDATKPSVSITAPSSGAVISTTTSVNANASDNVAVIKVEFYVNGSLKSTDSASPWSYSFNPANFGVGSYTLTAQAYDADGNTTISSPVNITVPDTTAPVISNVVVASTTGNQATITWTTDENSDSQIDYGTTSSYGSSSTLNTSLVKTHSVTLSGLDDATTYHFKVKSKDGAGNLATSTDRTLTTLDTTKPSVAITSPTGGSTQTGTITVAVTAGDNVGVSHVDFYVGGTFKQSLSSSPYNFSLVTDDYTSGSYTLTAKAYDAADNEQTASITITINNVTTPPPDTTPPTVSISSPAGNSTFNITGSAFLVNATAGDNIGVTKVEFYVDGSLKGTDSSGPYSYSLSPSSLGGGNHTLTAKAYDAANNSTTSAGVQITVKDTEKPTVSIVSPSAGSTRGGVINIQASAADNVGISSVQFFIDSNPTPIGSANTKTGGYYTISFSTILQTPGTHSIYAIAMDAASNSSQSATISFVVNNDFSVGINGFVSNAVLNKDSGGSRYNNSAYPVSLSIQSINPVQSVSVKLDGVALSVSPVAPNYSFTLNLTGLAIGQHNLAVTVTDSVGNTAVAAESFKVTYAADINSDYHVDYLDISALSHDYSKTGSGLGRVDINGDGVVDYLDISALSNAYGK